MAMTRKEAKWWAAVPLLPYASLPLWLDFPEVDPTFFLVVGFMIWGAAYTILSVFFAEYKPR